MPYASVAACPLVLEMFGLAYLRMAHWKIIEGRSTLLIPAPIFFNILQAFLVALPMCIALIVCVGAIYFVIIDLHANAMGRTICHCLGVRVEPLPLI